MAVTFDVQRMAKTILTYVKEHLTWAYDRSSI